ncbi:hypothetical protein GCM10009863_59860 [Streptomyces axinellae]|uniref:Transposase DDE domain-containing protein n=1 Tax=Streptomyces axinellae TaxID=552788 RepID=A0ABN3QUD7_9ACTN
MTNLPLHDTAQNQIWLKIIPIAPDLLAWMPLLALIGTARLWEPRRLRLRLFSTAAQLITTGRRRYLRLAGRWPWIDVITDALDRPRLPEPRLTSTFPSLRAAPAHRSRGTRRTPDATAGPSTCPQAPISALNKQKGPVSKLTGPSRKIEVNASWIYACARKRFPVCGWGVRIRLR